jgi:hypothetical protein
MRRNITLWALGTALAGLFTASPAAAVTIICVTPPSVPTCPNHTITAALGSAVPGAIIKLAPGTYYDDNIFIPPGLDGLQILGTSKAATILDIGSNTALGIASTGLGLIINSRNVVVKNMTIRNGLIGLRSVAPGTIVTGNNFTGQDAFPAQLTSLGAQFTLNEVHNTVIGVVSSGFGTIVKSNLITNTIIGIDLSGDQSQVQLNKVYNAVIGIDVPADGAQVKSNDVRYQTIGILTSGAFPTVQSNKVFGSQTGIQSVCANCFGGSLALNTVTDATAVGILVSSDNPGLYVQSNSVLRAGSGIVVANTAGAGNRTVFLVSNKASDVGNLLTGHCYSITGDGNVALKNQATRCSGSGFRVVGTGNSLESNVATNGFENGFTVDGAGVPYFDNYLNLNKTSGNTGDGFAIIGNASATTVQFNTAALNRKNFCDANDSGTSVISNSFPDPGGVVACDIVH